MNKTEIKICGLTSLNDIFEINKLLPEYVGFVFANSKRRVTKETALLMKKTLHQSIKSVGVFVNESMEFIKELWDEHIIDYVQLHGDEDVLYIEKLKEMVDAPIIKAIRVKDKKDIESAEKLDVSYILFDTYTPDSYGGSGKDFDCSMLSNLKKPFFLAGGLNGENIALKLKCCTPFAVDVSSGVETNGFKDYEKVKQFISLVRERK